MNNFTYDFLILIVAIAASIIVRKRALRQLSTEEKATLRDSFSSYRHYSTVVLLVLVVAYIAATIYYPRSDMTLTVIFIILLFTISGTDSVLSYQKLKKLNMPSGYIRSYLSSLVIRYAVAGALFLPMMWQAITMGR